MKPSRYALATWNASNRRSREDYYAHPLTTGLPDRYYAGCEHCQAARKTRRAA